MAGRTVEVTRSANKDLASMAPVVYQIDDTAGLVTVVTVVTVFAVGHRRQVYRRRR